MALTNLQANITLDVYDHDGAKPSIKTIALDDNTRYVLANIRSRGEVYDIGSSATVQLIVIRPDKVGVQIAGQAQGIEIGQEDESVVTVYGAYAELDQAAIVLPGTLLGQFKITSGDQILRTQIFQILNGEALDSDTWAGDYDGYNLDELVADVAEAVEKVGDLETDVAQIKEDLSEYEGIFTADVDESVQNWLDAHPEATTTIQDGAVTTDKLADKAVSKPTLADGVSELFDNTGFYDEVTVTTGTYINGNGNDTTYYVATVPKNDTEGNQIDIYAGYDTDVSPLGYAGKNLTTLTTNTSLDLAAGKPAVISNGEVVRESTFDGIASNYPFVVYVGFDSDRVPHEYPITTTPATMISDGIVNAAAAYYRLVRNRLAVDVSNIGLPASNLKAHPRMAMFTKSNGDICFLACDGRDSIDEGLTPSELAGLMIDLGAVDGWNMDGGGSTSLVVQCNKINRNVDGNGTEDRNIKVTWNVAHKFENSATQEAIAQIGIEKQRLIKQILTYIGISTTEEDTDPTTLDAGDYYIIHADNVPSEASTNGFAKVLRKRNSKVARVYWQPYSSSTVFLKWTNGVEPVTWSDWIKLDANEIWNIGVAIPTGSDFNNYTSVGKYRVISASVANNIANIPTKSAGTLFVFKSNNDDVLYQVYYTGYAKVYTRRINLGASPVEYGAWAISSEIRTKTVSATSDVDGVISLDSSFNSSEVLSMHTSGYIILPYKDGTAWKGKLLDTSLQPVAATVSVVVTHTLNTYINDVTS